MKMDKPCKSDIFFKFLIILNSIVNTIKKVLNLSTFSICVNILILSLDIIFDWRTATD